MAIVAVQRDRPEKEDKVDPLDRILKGLQIASNIYGIKTSVEQSDLNKIRVQREQQLLDSGKASEAAAKSDAGFSSAGLTTQDEFAKNNIQVDPEAFKAKYGKTFPITEYKIANKSNPEQVTTVYGVPQKTFQILSQADLKQQEFDFKKLLVSNKASEKLTAKENKVPIGTQKSDEAFARDYGKYVSEGTEAKNFDLLNKLDILINDAEKNLSEGLDEQLIGILPGGIRDVIDPEDKAIEDRLKAVAQKSLRETLGPQFTEKEGKMILDRAYNPAQPKSENLRRMKELTNSMRQHATAKKSAMDYFAENGTIHGFKAPQTQDIRVASDPSNRQQQGTGVPTLLGGFAPSQPALIPQKTQENDADFVRRYLSK